MHHLPFLCFYTIFFQGMVQKLCVLSATDIVYLPGWIPGPAFIPEISLALLTILHHNLLEEAQWKVHAALGGQTHLLQRTLANEWPDATNGIQTFNTSEHQLTSIQQPGHTALWTQQKVSQDRFHHEQIERNERSYLRHREQMLCHVK